MSFAPVQSRHPSTRTPVPAGRPYCCAHCCWLVQRWTRTRSDLPAQIDGSAADNRPKKNWCGWTRTTRIFKPAGGRGAVSSSRTDDRGPKAPAVGRRGVKAFDYILAFAKRQPVERIEEVLDQGCAGRKPVPADQAGLLAGVVALRGKTEPGPGDEADGGLEGARASRSAL